jgi:hypothetical protein
MQKARTLTQHWQTKVLLFTLLTGTSAAATWLLFLHLMQRSAWFAESVAKVSPDLANRFSCGCPFCNQQACVPPADELGLQRFHTLPSF